MSSAAWRLVAFGKPRLLNPSGEGVRCEVRTLALLTYLALEGPTSRSRLAGLLWPNTPEAAARNNLVHLLRRVAKSHHPDLIHAGEAVALGGGLESDVAAWGVMGAAPVESVPPGVLLDGLSFDDQPDLAEWVLAWRERLDLARAEQLAGAAAQAEAEGNFTEAIRLTRDLVDLDPLSEEAHRRLMRLLYLAGDRPAALRAYHRCRDLLERELGVEPLPETRNLARLIDRGAVEAPPPPVPRIPLSVLRPPVLVGRAAAWMQMEEAWAQGQSILLVGPAGSGKSRLMHDFVASKGPAFRLEGRPGDRAAPFSTTARMLRRVLDFLPAGFELPGWVMPALAPLLPETRADLSGSRPDPRMLEAIHVMSGVAIQLQGAVVSVFEDLHEVDAATTEMGMAMLASHFPLGQPGGLPHFVGTFRDEELDPETRGVFERFVAAGQSVWIDLLPLSETDVQELVGSLDITELEERGDELARFTGGNPLFVLETIKHMLEQGFTGTAGPLPVAGKVSVMITRRLAGLSTPALHAARAAAVLQSDFELERVAEVLRAPLLEVAAAWEELEEAQIMVGERFSHDLIAETLRQETPEGVRRLLHRAAARTLGTVGNVSPARVAGHWLAGGQGEQAAPWLVQAGHAAWRAARLEEAQRFFAEAAELLAVHDPSAAFGALALRAEVLANMDDPRHGDAVRALHAGAVTPLERATAFMQEYRALEGTMDVSRIEPALLSGLAALRAAEAGRETWLVEAQLTEGLALVAYVRGQREATLVHLRRLADLGERTGSLEWQAKAQEALGLALTSTSPREAGLHLERAEALHLRRNDVLRAGSSLAKLARVLCELGEVAAARKVAARGEAHLGRLDANHGERVALLYSQIMVAQSSGDLDLARALYDQAHRDHTAEHNALLGAFPVLHARTLRLAGHPEAAWDEVTRSRDGRPFPGHLNALRSLEEATILLALGRAAEADPLLIEAEGELQAAPNVPWQARLHDLRAARCGPAGEAHRQAARALREEHGLPNHHWSAL
ncbi:BTAD domain-containing putative transcriptional regulator [Deinococcus apachensis]|uniref:BTAD domain-containing putative transcriptional regulator n=1 Tax=Deinococcus apachensis TaxID=309886 RepID=UPI00036EAC45|nr:BTAD domain-containing putative transcriptional regulator [Deinococcus apachensis]